MDFEVDTDILRVTENTLHKDADRFNEELNLWNEEIDKLKTVWSGEDADIFYTRIGEYLLKLKMVSETENVFGNLLNKSYTTYEEQDSSFSSELKKDNAQYDDEEFLTKSGYSVNNL